MISEKKLKMLALLRGHHLRYEMKSKEVSSSPSPSSLQLLSESGREEQILLGRTTGESVVDVDLAEEGDASKVSRKQVPSAIVLFWLWSWSLRKKRWRAGPHQTQTRWGVLHPQYWTGNLVHKRKAGANRQAKDTLSLLSR